MLETDLRIWMKEVLGDDLDWVEPGRGIGAGRPDCEVKLPDKRSLPVELKLWELKRKGIEAKMRPAQIRYHYMTAHRKKGPTAIVYMIKLNDLWQIFLLNGKDVPQDKYKHSVKARSIFVANKSDKKSAARIKLINLLWSLK